MYRNNGLDAFPPTLSQPGLGAMPRELSQPGLGNIFDDLAKIAAKVGVVSHELSSVASGESNIATVPKDQAVIVMPVGGGVSKSIPLLPLALGAAALLYFGLRRR